MAGRFQGQAFRVAARRPFTRVTRKTRNKDIGSKVRVRGECEVEA